MRQPGAAFPDSSHQLVVFDSITEVIRSYEQGLVDYAIVPVENSIEGSVHQTVDYLFLQAEQIRARAEIVQPIKQQLMATDKEIEKIFSHPQAIAQSLKYVQHHFPTLKLSIQIARLTQQNLLRSILRKILRRLRQLPVV